MRTSVPIAATQAMMPPPARMNRNRYGSSEEPLSPGNDARAAVYPPLQLTTYTR